MAAQSSNGLTTKDLSVLQEQMDAEYRANRKASSYAQSISDPSLQGLASQLAQHHKQRFDAMYNFLNSQQ